MKLNRWQAFNPVWNQVGQLQAEMNQLFDRLGGDSRRFLGLAAYPPVNVWEEADVVHVEAELPGLDLNDLEIFVTGGNQLTIKGERKSQTSPQGVKHREERVTGAFTRVLALPFPVDADKVEARFENGVLHVTLPKHESARPRKIHVKAE
jgi:HSP20 family protein